MATRTIVEVRDANNEVIDLSYTTGNGGLIALRMDGYFTGPQFVVEDETDSPLADISLPWIDTILGVNVFVVDSESRAVGVHAPNGYYLVPRGASMDIWHPTIGDEGNPWPSFTVQADEGDYVLVTFYVSEHLVQVEIPS